MQFPHTAVDVVDFGVVIQPLYNTFNFQNEFLMILQLSIQCVENADGCPGVIIYGDETFPITSSQQVRFIPFSFK